MNMYLALALCFLPLAILLFVIVYFCKVKIVHALLAALLGLLTLVPISILQIYGATYTIFQSANWTAQLLRAFLISGLIEEAIKMLALFLFPRKNINFKHFFCCALLLGISLGCFESAYYFLQRLQHASNVGANLLYGQIFLRMFTSDAIHLLCSGLSSFFVWSLHRKKIALLPLIFAILVHTLYDFFALYEKFHFFAYIAIIFAIHECRIRYASTQNLEAENSLIHQPDR